MPQKALSLEKLLQENEIYASQVRKRVDDFVDLNFTLKNCVELQKRSFLSDLLINPINAMWVIPYLTLKKIFEIADKLGFDKFNDFAAKLPATLPSGFQKKIDHLLVTELFESSSKNVDSDVKEAFDLNARTEIRAFSLKQAGLSDLTSSAISYLVAHQYFGNSSLSIFEIGNKIAALWARDEAASKFFLGKSIGKTFYSVAPPPAPSTWQLVLATAMLLLAVSVLTTAISTFFPVIQRKLGFLKQNLLKLISSVEDKSALQLTKKSRISKVS